MNNSSKCSHYIRWCIPVCMECKSESNKKDKQMKNHCCHYCHNELEMHDMDRSNIKMMKCLLCGCYQESNNGCKNPECYGKTHNLYCKKCAIWDHKVGKNIAHCDKCGICRLGSKSDIKHCDKCNMCWNIQYYDNHTCKINQMGRECLICMEQCWDNQVASTILRCGHIFHPKCISGWMKENYVCPICKKTAYDGTALWAMIENYVNSMEIPDEYKDWRVNILCNDCEEKSNVKYGIYYHKCPNDECGSWNTRILDIIKSE